jgi:hypothetical protein
MTNAITFDAGALIAIERRSRRMQALLDELDRREWQVAVPAGAVAPDLPQSSAICMSSRLIQRI